MLIISHLAFQIAKRGIAMHVAELLCVGLERSVASLLPWDIPWYDPSHAVFFLAFYGALGAIGLGLMVAMARTLMSLRKKDVDH